MKVKDLRKVIWTKRVVGAAIGIVSLYLMVNAFLWGLWISLNAGGGFGVHLADQVARLYTLIHVAPALDFLVKPMAINELLAADNLYFLGAYVFFIVSALLIGSANSQARMLGKAIRNVEQRNLERAIGSESAISQASANVDDAELPPMGKVKIAKHVYVTFLAPIVVGVLIAVILKLLGMD